MNSLIIALALCGTLPPLTPTPPMRIEQVYKQMEDNRAVRILPGTLPQPYYTPPLVMRPFDNYPSPYFTPYTPYYSPYYYRPYWRY